MTEADPTLGRLDDQISWYDRKSNYSQRVYKWLKIIEVIAAALVPLFAGFHLPAAELNWGRASERSRRQP